MKQIPNAKESNPVNWLRHRPVRAGVFGRFTRNAQRMPGRPRLTGLMAALIGGALFTSTSAQAALMAYEGFNYGTGNANLTGLSGGFGWSGAWQGVNNGSSSVVAGNLTAGANAPAGYDSLSTGNAAFTPNGTRTGRWLDTSASGAFGVKGYINGNGDIGANGKTVYISFLQQPNGTSVYYEFELHRNNLGDPGREAGVGNDAGDNNVHFRIENPPGGGSTFSDLGAGNTGVNFYVVRIDFQSGNSTVTIYRNPTSATEAGATLTQQITGVTADLSFDGISLGAFVGSITVAHDEIRVGETWADVVSPGASSTGLWDGGGADANWSTGGNWDNNTVPVFATSLTFAGSTKLNNNNDLTGVSANNLVFDAAAGAFTLNGNSLGLNGTINFNGNPALPITQTINLPLVPTGDITLAVPTNANLALTGGVTSGGWLTKTDIGTLTLGGNNTFAALTVGVGTNVITGSTTFTGGSGRRLYVADGDFINGCKATMIIQPGATLTVTGNYEDAFVLGRDSGSATLIQNGGTFNFAIGNNKFIFVGASGNPATRSEYDMNGGLLDMNGNTLGVALGANTVITGLVNQVSGVISNVGQLYFSPFFTQGHGIYNLTGGSIYIGAGGITNYPGSSYEVNLGGGTIAAGASWLSTMNLTLTGSNGPVTFNPAGNQITLSGVLSGSGGLTLSGGGILALTGANTYTGDTTVNTGGILQLVGGSSTGALRVNNGGMVDLSSTYVVGSFYTNGVALPVGTYNSGNLPAFISGSGNLQVASGISTGRWIGQGANGNWSTSGNWDNNAVPVFPHALTFAGSSQLNNNNDLSSITISSLIFDAAAGAFTIGGNDVTLSGNISFNGIPAAPITQTVNFNLTWNADKTIDTPTNGNLVLGGSINAAAYNLTKTGAGMLTLGGNDSFVGYYLNGGTNIITGNVAINGNNSFAFIGNGNTAYGGTLIIQPGASLTMSGGFSDAFVVGRDGGSGRVIQNGGTFSYSNPSHTYLFVGATSHPGTQAEYDMNGGVLDLNGSTLGIALGDNNTVYTATLNQTGGDINNVFTFNLGALTPFGHGVYNLSGGSISIDFGGIVSTSGSYEMNLGGGTIGAIFDWNSSLNMNLTNFNGSTTFSPNGNTITLAGKLSGIGGLIVNGGGTLKLTGTNASGGIGSTYTGDSIITNGATLELDAAGTFPSALRIVDGSYLNLNNNGTLVVTAFSTNGVALPNGTYNAANLSGFIQGSGSLQVAGLAFSSEPQSQVVYLNKNGSASFSSTVVGGSATYQWYLNDTAIPGATSNSLNLSNLQITNAGNIYLVATGNSGSITSSVVPLTIYAVNNNLFAYDGLDYAPGSVDGSSQAGGSGWNGPWQAVDGNGVIITAGSLVGGANVPAGYDSRSIGNLIEVPSNAQTRAGRNFDTSGTSELFKQGFVDGNGNVGANGKTIYLSFLQQPDRTSGFYELEFHRGSLSDPGRIGGIGNDTGTGNVNLRAPNGVNNRSLGAGTTTPNLYVVRIDYKAGNDDVFVYRNPASLTEPTVPTLTVSNVSDLSLSGVSVAAYNGPDVKMDEVRLGATFADALGLAVSNLLPPTKTVNGYKVQFAITPNAAYRVQRATSLTGPWTDLTNGTAPANGYVEYEDTAAPAGNAFYRTVTP